MTADVLAFTTNADTHAATRTPAPALRSVASSEAISAIAVPHVDRASYPRAHGHSASVSGWGSGASSLRSARRNLGVMSRGAGASHPRQSATPRTRHTRITAAICAITLAHVETEREAEVEARTEERSRRVRRSAPERLRRNIAHEDVPQQPAADPRDRPEHDRRREGKVREDRALPLRSR